MFCIFFPDKYIKENSKFQSMTTLGIKELTNGSGKRGNQTDCSTRRIYTSNKAPGLGQRASSPISVMMGLKKHRFLQGSGKLSGTNSDTALSDRGAFFPAPKHPQPGVCGLALGAARAGHPLLDPPAPDVPIKPLGARRRVCRCS